MIKRSSRELVLITGVHGFLGQHVLQMFLNESRADLALSARQPSPLIRGLDREPRIVNYLPLDLTDRFALRDAVLSLKPDVIVNCAGFVNVDRAEHERETAWRTNTSAVEYLIDAARKTDARIVHVSTDYIFDGTRSPYSETAAPNPLNYYGRTKLASENALRSSGIHHAILRTTMLYGSDPINRRNIIESLPMTIKQAKQYSAFTDVSTAPTYITDAAFALVRLTETHKHGIYHLCGSELLSRYDFAVRIARVFSLDDAFILPVSAASLESEGGRAVRPKQTAFITLKIQTELSLRLTSVNDGIQIVARERKESNESTRSFIYT